MSRGSEAPAEGPSRRFMVAIAAGGVLIIGLIGYVGASVLRNAGDPGQAAASRIAHSVVGTICHADAIAEPDAAGRSPIEQPWAVADTAAAACHAAPRRPVGNRRNRSRQPPSNTEAGGIGRRPGRSRRNRFRPCVRCARGDRRLHLVPGGRGSERGRLGTGPWPDRAAPASGRAELSRSRGVASSRRPYMKPGTLPSMSRPSLPSYRFRSPLSGAEASAVLELMYGAQKAGVRVAHHRCGNYHGGPPSTSTRGSAPPRGSER